MKDWLFLVAAILAEVIATSSLKASVGFTKLWPSVIVVLGYGLAFYFLSLALRTIPVGIAYAIWAGLGIALISLAGWVFFGQKLDAASIVGIGLIVAGVAVINIFSKVSVH
ncbi:DMT family transporter [Desulfosoma caldarium]|uniref:Small multidrug resistance pump n=1 Tax=Desulfosoma caldarium TaxID=610254 RepID=A0A3N1UUV6_9BACT|nr:SMR family transporter [Desulfosoma caldarium]ROQ90896.1 small multidrug resistance pump [Desulfosoma caldarium]